MSFIIAVHVNEGIVVASDRRTTYTNTIVESESTIQRIGVHVTNSTDKTFKCPNGAGISICGDASIMGKPISGFVKDMIRKNVDSECKIVEMPELIIKYFKKISSEINVNFIVAGYESDGENKIQRMYKINLKDETTDEIDTSSQGASWDGETLTLVRLIQNVAVKNVDGSYLDIPNDEILWNYFTLQDAVDFARYAVETTINTMRFKNVVETVGGKVDILLITPKETKWLQKEHIQ